MNERRRFEITKQEEGRALQYIIDELIPKASLEYNALVKKHNEKGPSLDYWEPITDEMVRKKLKKNTQDWDWIEYGAEFPVTNLLFAVSKRKFRDEIYGEGDPRNPQALAIAHWKVFPPKPYGSKESWIWITLKNFQTERLNEVTDPYSKNLTKEDEYRGLIFIKQALVPRAVKIANDFITKTKAIVWEPTTVEDVIKNLKVTKKTSERINYGYGPTEAEQNALYGDEETKRKIPMEFFIEKGKSSYSDDPNKWFVMAGYENPLRMERHWYIVEFNKDGTPRMSFQESHIPGDEYDTYYITKKEEDFGLQFIKDQFLPNIVTAYNKEVKKNPRHEDRVGNIKTLHIASEDHVRRTLKKVNRETKHHAGFNIILSDEIIYQAEAEDKNIFYFTLRKSRGSAFKNHLSAGFQTPLCRGTHYIRIDRYKSDRLMLEATEQDVSLSDESAPTRKEEMRALDYIKKVLMPFSSHIWNYASALNPEIRRVTPEELSRNLRKIEGPPRASYASYSIKMPEMGRLGRKTIIFDIYKTISDELVVSLYHPYYHYETHHYVGESKPIFNPKKVDIQEADEKKEIDYFISKKEEAYAVNYILEHLLPINLKDYNESAVDLLDRIKHFRNPPKIKPRTYEEIRKRFRKIYRHRSSNKDTISYTAHGPNADPMMEYRIFKNIRGELVVGYSETVFGKQQTYYIH